MPRRPSRLTNCYVPLPLPSDKSSSHEPAKLPRSDGRQEGHELRQLVVETSVLSKNQAMGSSLVELGHTKVIGEVHIVAGTTAENRIGGGGAGGNSSAADDGGGTLVAVLRFAPHIGVDEIAQRAKAVSALDYTPLTSAGKIHQETSLNESGLSTLLTAALTDVVPLHDFPKTMLVVKVTVLQDDGSCLSAAITAATLALVDAKVEMYDLVTSCTVAVIRPPIIQPTKTAMNYHDTCDDDDDDTNLLYLADPTYDEADQSQAVICLAMTPNHKDVTLWSQSGRLSSSMANQAMELCRDGCRTFHKLMREAITSKVN
jgi:exosome complex component MTR3